jgi:SAM-dependent methyltransferase
MHDSSFEKMDAFVRIHLAASRGRSLEILDFGSQTVDDQPRSYRELFDDPSWTYRGLDIEAGANVDVVVADPYEWSEIGDDAVDLVVSGQAFEHVEYFWASMFEIVRVLRPGGLAVIIAPSTGFEHRYPVDCWRFYRDGFVALAEYVDCEVVDAFTDWDREVWGDSILVARKPRRDDSERHRFAVRSWMQRALMAGDLTSLPPMPDAVGADPEPTALAPVRPGDLVAELQRIRDAHLAEDAEAAAASKAQADAELAAAIARLAREMAGPPSPFAVAYGRVRAAIAAIAGPSGRRAYKRLRGRS